jgi:hypothetical protein
VVRKAFHCELGKRRNVNSVSPASSRLSTTAGQRQPHFLREPGPRLLDGGDCLRVDHPPVILGQLLSEARGRVRLQVPQLVRRATLDRQTGPVRHERRGEAGIPVDHGQRRPWQVPRHEAGDDLAPARRTVFPGQPQVQHDPLATA